MVVMMVGFVVMVLVRTQFVVMVGFYRGGRVYGDDRVCGDG